MTLVSENPRKCMQIIFWGKDNRPRCMQANVYRNLFKHLWWPTCQGKSYRHRQAMRFHWTPKLKPEEPVQCTFSFDRPTVGFLFPTKQNHELLDSSSTQVNMMITYVNMVIMKMLWIKSNFMKCTNDWSTWNSVQILVSFAHAQMQRVISPLSRTVPLQLHTSICKYLIFQEV